VGPLVRCSRATPKSTAPARRRHTPGPATSGAAVQSYESVGARSGLGVRGLQDVLADNPQERSPLPRDQGQWDMRCASIYTIRWFVRNQINLSCGLIGLRGLLGDDGLNTSSPHSGQTGTVHTTPPQPSPRHSRSAGVSPFQLQRSQWYIRPSNLR
jgi:hypothetical protein